MGEGALSFIFERMSQRNLNNSSVGLLAGAGVAIPLGSQTVKADKPISNSPAYQQLSDRAIEAQFDVNLQIGINAKIVGEKLNYFVDFRLARGLMDIFYERSKIISLNVNAGVLFPFDRRD